MNKQHGFTHFGLLAAVFAVIAVIGFAAWRVMNTASSKADTQATASQPAATASQTSVQQATKQTAPVEPDSADTLANPTKVTSSDQKTYFVYGAPAGQNNKHPKRIIVSLPGHSTSADDGYKAWKTHIEGGQYALAEFNWWDGKADQTPNYYTPTAGTQQIQAFLKSQGYTSSDIIILHGFSRGSANTYGYIANDKRSASPVFDAVISNSGQYEPYYPIIDGESNPSPDQLTKYYKGMPWILVCGGKDTDSKTSCESMAKTKAFLEIHQAKVLATLTDPNQGHGVFHMSSLQLPKQALELIETAVH